MKNRKIEGGFVLTIAAVLVLTAIPSTTADHNGYPDACQEGTAVMTQYGDVINGQAGSSAILYRGVDTSGQYHWAVSYTLETNTMDNEADRTAFYAEVAPTVDDEREWGQEVHFFESDKTGGACKYIGSTDKSDVIWWVLGGATGWTTSETCYYELWAEVTVGVKFGIDGGTEASMSAGGSYGCENGGSIDSGILVAETNEGSSCLPGGCEQDYPSTAIT